MSASTVKDEPVEDGEDPLQGDIVLLTYEKQLLLDTMDEDVLFIAARGLGIERLFLNHLVMYSDHKLLFLVLNTNQYDESYFISKLKEFNVPCTPKVINSDVSTRDRESIYLEGGVQFITSRILTVDLLTDRVPINNVAGILIYRAHQVLNSFQESFILRLFREKKRHGLVKAFSDVPNSMSSLGKLQRVVDRLYVKKVVSLPRYHDHVKEILDSRVLIEFDVSLPTAYRRIHTTLQDLIKVCIRELKQCSASSNVEDDNISSGSNLYIYQQSLLEKHLIEKRTFATEKQKRLLCDLEVLRELLRVAEDTDIGSLLIKLNAMKCDREIMEKHMWLSTPTASRMIADVDLVCGGKDRPFCPPPKWKILSDVLDEVKDLPFSEDEVGEEGPSVLIFVSSDQAARQLGDVVRFGPKFVEWNSKRQIGRACGQPENTPLWNPDEEVTRVFLRCNLTTEERSELMSGVQKDQRENARAAKKRRKAAEGLLNSDAASGKQTSITQFGIMHFKKKRVDEPGPSTEAVKEEPEDAVEDGEPQLAKTLKEFPKAPLVITPVGEKYNTLRYLEKSKPNVIILYNTDLTIIRQIEIYKACNPAIHLVVYQLMYTSSTEEDRYLTSINNETLAFDFIIKEQTKLLIPRVWDVTREDPPTLSVSTRDGGGAPLRAEGERPKIIVDMREFNSELPTVLYKKGFDVVAATLEVGDYVLSPDIAVERKALDDLTQSLQSGRVFKQIEQMLRHYANSILLVESNRKFETKLVNGGPFQGELSRHCREIRQQLCGLIRQFPRMKLIWSLSPTNSAEYFGELKTSLADPDVEKAVALRGDELPDEQKGGEKKTGAKPNAVLVRQLSQSLPAMKRGDVLKIMNSDGKVSCLRDLFTSTPTVLYDVTPEHADRLAVLATFDFSGGDNNL